MSKTMGQLLTSVRDRLDEPNAKFWTDPQIERWINEGARDICRQAECLQTTATISVVANTQQYTLPQNIVRIYRVEFQRTGDSQVYTLQPRDYNNMDDIWVTQKTVQVSVPSYYTLWGYPSAASFQILLYPTSSSAGTITLYYYQMPTEIPTDGSGDSTVIQLPEGWEDLIVDYAEYYALRKDSDPRWQDAKGIYQEKLSAMVATSARWNDQESFIVGDGGMGFVPNWLYGGGY